MYLLFLVALIFLNAISLQNKYTNVVECLRLGIEAYIFYNVMNFHCAQWLFKLNEAEMNITNYYQISRNLSTKFEGFNPK